MVTKNQLDLAKKLAYYESEVEKVKREMKTNPVSSYFTDQNNTIRLVYNFTQAYH